MFLCNIFCVKCLRKKIIFNCITFKKQDNMRESSAPGSNKNFPSSLIFCYLEPVTKPLRTSGFSRGTNLNNLLSLLSEILYVLNVIGFK